MESQKGNEDLQRDSVHLISVFLLLSLLPVPWQYINTIYYISRYGM